MPYFLVISHLIIIINKMQHNFIKNLSILTILAIFFTSCSKEKFNFPSTKDVPTKGIDRARKNVEEGRGVTLGGLARGPKTTYEFSTSNPLWRASLEILDFIPMSTVDYSGGMIISDWYTDKTNTDAIKITIRFLSNEIQTNSIKIILHKKVCTSNSACTIKMVQNSKISQELKTSIIKKAALIDKQSKNKKKR